MLEVLQPLQPARLFLEGRRGDDYVSPERLREIRDFFGARNIECSGGIAPVPGEKFGLRQTGGLAWMNWERTDGFVHPLNGTDICLPNLPRSISSTP